jgi:CheY-like chemotaxis protein
VDALVTAGEWRPDVILLDLHIADLDGLRVCRRLTEIGGEKRTRVAVFLPADGVATSGLARGTTDVVCLPDDLPAPRVMDILKQEELVPGASPS